MTQPRIDWLGTPDPEGVPRPVGEPDTSAAPPPPPPPPQAPPPPPGRRGPGGIRTALLAALVGGLVGALAASGVFVIVDDDGTEGAPIVRATPDAAVSRPSRALASGSDIAAIIAKVEPAVVAITTGAGPGTGNGGAGTGFVITSDGYIVTNSHVVNGASRITVAFTNGDEESATLVGREVASDLAVLKVNRTNLPTVQLCDSEVQVGDEVVAIGNALALQGGLSITRGIVSGLHRTVSTDTGITLIGMLQTDAAINRGNSGGPLVDAAGCVIAINAAIANPESANNVGFAIPMTNARPVIDDLRLGRPAAFLGVGTMTVTPSISRQQDLGVSSGALVTRITAGSAADQAGIREGDVIVSIAGKPVAEAADVQALVRGQRPGDRVRVGIVRAKSEQVLEAILTERPAT